MVDPSTDGSIRFCRSEYAAVLDRQTKPQLREGDTLIGAPSFGISFHVTGSAHLSMHNRKAFTLVELVITMALFALVAGLAVAFISYMWNFNRSNDKTLRFLENVQALREETDMWFSAFDSVMTDINVYGTTPQNGEDGRSILAAAEGAYGEYTIYSMLEPDRNGEFILTYVFEYPPNGLYHGTLENNCRVIRLMCDNIASVAYYDYSGWNFSESNDTQKKIRFGISLKVTGETFVCEIAAASVAGAGNA